MATSRMFPFACPVCGRMQVLSEKAMRRIGRGARSGECRPGEGCREAVSRPERRRRWWLRQAGVQERAIRAAGGAVSFVAEFGAPGLCVWPLVSLETERLLRRNGFATVAGDGGSETAGLAGYAYRQAGREPELALWIAVEMVARRVTAGSGENVQALVAAA